MGPVIERSSPAIQRGNVQNAAGGVSSTSVIHHHHQQVDPVPVFLRFIPCIPWKTYF